MWVWLITNLTIGTSHFCVIVKRETSFLSESPSLHMQKINQPHYTNIEAGPSRHSVLLPWVGFQPTDSNPQWVRIPFRAVFSLQISSGCLSLPCFVCHVHVHVYPPVSTASYPRCACVWLAPQISLLHVYLVM